VVIKSFFQRAENSVAAPSFCDSTSSPWYPQFHSPNPALGLNGERVVGLARGIGCLRLPPLVIMLRHVFERVIGRCSDVFCTHKHCSLWLDFADHELVKTAAESFLQLPVQDNGKNPTRGVAELRTAPLLDL